MTFEIYDHPLGYSYLISIWLRLKNTTGEHEQEFRGHEEGFNTKLQALSAARKKVKFLLKNIEKTIEHGIMTEVVTWGMGQPGTVRVVKIQENWRIE